MSDERRLLDAMRKAMGPVPMAVMQGVVTVCDGLTCTCRFGSAEVSGIRLRASLTERERQTLLVPKVGSAVIVGSLGGDYSELVVLQVDEVESIVFNGGRLGGLVNIDALTEKINGLIDAFNDHTHSIPPSGVTVEGTTNIQPVTVPAVVRKADRLKTEDFEDKNIRH